MKAKFHKTNLTRDSRSNDELDLFDLTVYGQFQEFYDPVQGSRIPKPSVKT